MQKKRLRVYIVAIIVLSLLGLVVSCSSVEEKRAKFFNRGKELFEKKDYAKARVEFKNAIQVDPKFADAYYWLGKAEFALQNVRGAFGSFSKAVELNPDHLEAQIDLARIYLLARQPDKALEKANLVLAKEGGNTKALLLKAAALGVKKDFQEALNLMEKVVADTPEKVEAYVLGSQFHVALKDPAAAEEMLQAGLKAASEKTVLYHALANLYIIEKRLDDAEKIYKQVIAFDPKEARHRLALARLYAGQRRFDQAEAELRAVADMDKTSEDHLLPLVQFLILKRQVTEAEGLLTGFIQKNPGGYKARFALAEIYLNTRQPEKALKVYEEAAAHDPKNPNAGRARSQMALVYLGQGKLDKALEITAGVLEDNPRDISALRVQGRAYLAKKDAVNAVSALRTLVKEVPKDPEALLFLGQAHRLNKEYSLAEEQFKKALSLNEEYAPAREALGDFYVERKDFARAEKTFQELASRYPKDPRGNFKLGLMYRVQGDNKKALSAFGGSLEINPNFTAALAQIVQIHIQQKELEKALSAVERQTKVSPKNPVLHEMLGELAAGLGKAKLAAGAFEKAIGSRPEWLTPYYNLAALYLRERQSTKAIEVLQKAQEIAPDTHRTSFLLANAYEQKGERDKARALYDKLLARNPEDPYVANNLAYLYADAYPTKENLDKAVKIAQGALARDPKNPNLADTLGWIYFKQGRLSDAGEQVKKALSVLPKEPIFNYHLGMILTRKGDHLSAQQAFKTAVEGGRAFPGREEALKMLGER
ncbi:MAG TPA: tetratricopeptide repeat protein [Proteobacteria bacterium]|nr:tetratricopeptide repeat protein [Pseudomonadota bacterium]